MNRGKVIGTILAIAVAVALMGLVFGGLVSPGVRGVGQNIAPGELEYGIGPRKLARTSDGVLHCVYSRSDGEYSQVYYSYSGDGGMTWTEEQITTAAHNHLSPCIAVGSNDHIHVAWYYCGGGTWGNTCTTQYREKAAVWQSIEDVITGYHRLPAIAVDSDDNVHCIVSGSNPGGYNCNHAKYLVRTASGWSLPEAVSSTCWAGSPPSIAVDQTGDVHVVYSHAPRSGPHYGLRYRKRTASGWQSEEVIQTDDLDWSPGSIALDSGGNVYVVYFLGWASSSTGAVAGPIKISRRTASGWQPAEDVSPASEYPQRNPTISVDGNDHLHVVWQGKHSGSPDYYQIRYRRYAGNWSSVDNLTSAAVDQEYPSLIWAWWPALDDVKPNIAQSGYAFVWEDGSDVRFYRSNDLAWENDSICAVTATGTGTACFTASDGSIEDLEPVPPHSLPSVLFPHGMFSFKITGLTPGQGVTLTIEFPSPLPIGTMWWKYDTGRWHALRNESDDGDNIMVITLIDGGKGDLDSIAGQITDPGGPGNPMTVGWETYPTNKTAVTAPWIVLAAAIVVGIGVLVPGRRHTGSGHN